MAAVGHLGNSGITPQYTSQAVISHTTGIDVFIDGHSHEDYERTVRNASGEDVLLAQTGTRLAAIGKVVIDPATGERRIRNGETNLVADAYRVVMGADIGMVNGGGIRADIEPGDVTCEDIINVHPYGNEMCVVEATGQEILDALELGVMNYPLENGGFQHVSGLTFSIDVSHPFLRGAG